MNSTLLIRSAVFLWLLFAVAPSGASQLDPGFGEAGFRRLTELEGIDHTPLGSCPHADGSLSLVFNRAANPSVAIARMLPNGALDTDFGSDGMSSVYLGTMLRSPDYAVACQNTLNADPADDRMLIASRRLDETGEAITFLTIDLNTQTATQVEIGLLQLLLRDDVPVYTQVFVRGLHPLAGGGWLVTGAVDNDDVPGMPQAGFVLRIAADQSMVARMPSTSALAMLEFNAAYLGSDGYLRAIGRASTSAGQAWALLKLDPVTLQAVSAVSGMPGPNDLLLHRGRIIGSDLLAIGSSRHVPFDGFAPQASEAPRLLVARLDQISEVILPPIPALFGEPQLLPASSTAAAVTGASGGRVIFVGGLSRATRSRTGTYVAMVKLGNGTTIADRVDRQFGAQGAEVFAHRPEFSGCAGNDAPIQQFGNISSWGNDTALLGFTHMLCPTSQSTYLYAARIRTINPDVLLVDDFEG